jgi:hypothetical protein
MFVSGGWMKSGVHNRKGETREAFWMLVLEKNKSENKK